MRKKKVVSLRMDRSALELLAHCRRVGGFPTTAATVLAGLLSLDRELARQHPAEETVKPTNVGGPASFSTLGLARWAEVITRADRRKRSAHRP